MQALAEAFSARLVSVSSAGVFRPSYSRVFILYIFVCDVDLSGTQLGDAEQRVRELFRDAVEGPRPAIVCFDNIV